MLSTLFNGLDFGCALGDDANVSFCVLRCRFANSATPPWAWVRQIHGVCHSVQQAIIATRQASDDVSSILRQAARAIGTSGIGWPEIVSSRLHPAASAVFRHVISDALGRPNVSIVSRGLGCSARQLQREFSHAGLPSPHRLIVLSRWLAVAGMLRDRRATGYVARRLGYSSTQALCKAAVRETRLSVAELRDDEAIARLLADLLTAYQAPSQGPASMSRIDHRVSSFDHCVTGGRA